MFLLSEILMLLLVAATTTTTTQAAEEKGETMIKMCLFYPSPSGHARSDPIINQQCASDHVHTFYGPQNFHPETSNADLVKTSPKFSTTPFVENQSLYWVSRRYRIYAHSVARVW